MLAESWTSLIPNAVFASFQAKQRLHYYNGYIVQFILAYVDHDKTASGRRNPHGQKISLQHCVLLANTLRTTATVDAVPCVRSSLSRTLPEACWWQLLMTVDQTARLPSRSLAALKWNVTGVQLPSGNSVRYTRMSCLIDRWSTSPVQRHIASR